MTAPKPSPPVPIKAVAAPSVAVPKVMVPTVEIVPETVLRDWVLAVNAPPSAKVLPAPLFSVRLPVLRKARSLLTDPPASKERL